MSHPYLHLRNVSFYPDRISFDVFTDLGVSMGCGDLWREGDAVGGSGRWTREFPSVVKTLAEGTADLLIFRFERDDLDDVRPDPDALRNLPDDEFGVLCDAVFQHETDVAEGRFKDDAPGPDLGAVIRLCHRLRKIIGQVRS